MATNNKALNELSIIIPFRADDQRQYLVKRLRAFCDEFEQRCGIEYLLVDSGSSLMARKENKTRCTSAGIRYLYHESMGQVFSIGMARDYGVQHATGKLITFLDIDLIPTYNFAEQLLEFAELSGMSSELKRFFVLPCLYLSEYGTEQFLKKEKKTRHREYLYKHTMGDKLQIDNMAYCSSVMVVHRFHYLSIGGHRALFKGHGYEDFELIHRLSMEEGRTPRSFHYYTDTKSWDSNTFDGFRAHFSLLGIPALKDGLCTVHLWHPRPANTTYTKNIKKNHLNAFASFKQFDNDGCHPPALLPATLIENKVLYFGVPETNAGECLRNLVPHLGQFVYHSEYHFNDEHGRFSVSLLEVQIRSQKIKCILFSNPYANPIRLAVYHWARENNFPFYCFERGALTDSWFVDDTGFSVDSTRYNESYWQTPLSTEQCSSVTEYIQNTLDSEQALEHEGERKTKIMLVNSLKTSGKKVLFVPFQDPNDTVIKHFSGSIQSIDKFAIQIDRAAKKLIAYGWHVICKKHPLETVTPALKYARWVDDDIHLLDLLDLADAVALINSSVGVYSMMMEKPCYIFGEAFYAHPKLNKPVNSANELVDDLRDDSFKVCAETMRCFIHYLWDNYYSYGIPLSDSRVEKDGSKNTITKGIAFYRINIPEQAHYLYKKPKGEKISLNAPLLARYAHDILQREKPIKKMLRNRDKWKFKTWFKPQSRAGKHFKKIILHPKAYCLDSKYAWLNYLANKI